MLVAGDHRLIATLVTDYDGHDLLVEALIVLCGYGSRMGACGQLVLLFAGDAVLAPEILGRLDQATWPGVVFVAGGFSSADQSIMEMDRTPGVIPKGGGVVLHLAHALGATGYHYFGDSHLDLHRSVEICLEARSAPTVDLEAGCRDAQAGVKGRDTTCGGCLATGVTLTQENVVNIS